MPKCSKGSGCFVGWCQPQTEKIRSMNHIIGCTCKRDVWLIILVLISLEFLDSCQGCHDIEMMHRL